MPTKFYFSLAYNSSTLHCFSYFYIKCIYLHTHVLKSSYMDHYNFNRYDFSNRAFALSCMTSQRRLLHSAANALWTALCLCLRHSANFELLCAIPHERTGILEALELHLNQERWRQWLEKLQPVSLLSAYNLFPKVIANRIQDTLHFNQPKRRRRFSYSTSSQVINKWAECNPYVFGINAGYEKAQWHRENFSSPAGITTSRRRRATYVEIQGYVYSDPIGTTVFNKGSNKLHPKGPKTGSCHLHDDDQLVMRVQLKSRSCVHKNVTWVLCMVSRAGFRRLSVCWSKWGSFLWSGSSQWTKYIDCVNRGWHFIFHALHMQDCV